MRTRRVPGSGWTRRGAGATPRAWRLTPKRREGALAFFKFIEQSGVRRVFLDRFDFGKTRRSLIDDLANLETRLGGLSLDFLTVLHLDALDDTPRRVLLARTPNLEDLELKWGDWSDGVVNPLGPPPRPLPKLR